MDKYINKIIEGNCVEVMKQFDDEVIDLVSDIGYDPEFGARPMERVIQNIVENPLAKELLELNFIKEIQ